MELAKKKFTYKGLVWTQRSELQLDVLIVWFPKRLAILAEGLKATYPVCSKQLQGIGKVGKSVFFLRGGAARKLNF